MPVVFNSADVEFKFPKGKLLANFVLNKFKKQSGKKLNLNYVFCSDEYLLGMNKQFLGHDYYTDIITFPIEEDQLTVTAEIYISIDRVKDNAKELKLEWFDELRRVMFHGVIHLVGFKDKTRAEKAEMRNEEDRWLNEFKLNS